MALTDVEIRKAKPAKAQYKMADSHGLYVAVTPQGNKIWRWKYYFEGKERSMSFGRYPEVSLTLARKRHADGRIMLAEGVDPVANRKAEKAEGITEGITFQKVAEEWHQHCLGRSYCSSGRLVMIQPLSTKKDACTKGTQAASTSGIEISRTAQSDQRAFRGRHALSASVLPSSFQLTANPFVFCRDSLSGVSRDLVAYRGEGSVDVGCHSAHTCRCGESDKCNDQRILDEILAVFTAQNVLNLDRQLPQLLFHALPPRHLVDTSR